MCESISPGTTMPAPASNTFVSLPRYGANSSREPMATILSSLTAMASTNGRCESPVQMRPSTTIVAGLGFSASAANDNRTSTPEGARIKTIANQHDRSMSMNSHGGDFCAVGQAADQLLRLRLERFHDLPVRTITELMVQLEIDGIGEELHGAVCKGDVDATGMPAAEAADIQRIDRLFCRFIAAFGFVFAVRF